jgi:hypothetical protein
MAKKYLFSKARKNFKKDDDVFCAVVALITFNKKVLSIGKIFLVLSIFR